MSPMLGIMESSKLKNPYPIGSTGPGGGIVFYDAGSTLSWGRWLEAAVGSTSPSWSDTEIQWSGNQDTLVGTNTAIGTGRANTQAAYSQNSTSNKAVSKTWTYTGGGFNSTVNAATGWFLPSKDELNQLYIRKTTVGGFTGVNYYSSSEVDAQLVWVQNFNNGTQDGYFKNNNQPVRAIRAF